MEKIQLEARYFSQNFEISLKGDETWFDTRLDRDTQLYIDPFLAFKSNIPEFKDTRNKFNTFFEVAIEMIFRGAKNSNSLEKLENNILYFREAGEIQLGDSTSCKPGNGPGRNFSKSCINALQLLIHRGFKEIDHFEKIQIFTPRIGVDGISDTTAHILKEEFINYTQRICSELNIQTSLCPIEHAEFNYEDKRWESKCLFLPENPFCPKQGILLVPKEFLCTSNAINSKGFSKYVARQKSRQLSVDLNYEIEENISKEKIREIANKYPEWIDEYILELENDKTIAPYDLSEDRKNLYRSQKDAHGLIFSSYRAPSFSTVNDDNEFTQCVESIINIFKLNVEEEKGYQLLWNEAPEKTSENPNPQPTPRKEKAVQLLFWCIVKHYCEANNIDPSPEVETGRGPVDFKFSSGYRNRVLIELKLASSSKLKQGFQKQLSTYLNAHKVFHGYYVIIFYNDKQKKKIDKALQEFNSEYGDLQGKIIIVDATRNKPSASNL